MTSRERALGLAPARRQVTRRVQDKATIRDELLDDEPGLRLRGSVRNEVAHLQALQLRDHLGRVLGPFAGNRKPVDPPSGVPAGAAPTRSAPARAKRPLAARRS